jgi:phosphotransferase system enzyme I (PtsI)
MRNKVIRGIPASPGIVMSKTLVYSSVGDMKPESLRETVGTKTPKSTAKADRADFEIRKFEAALEEARREIEVIRDDFLRRTDDHHARILDAQLLVTEDATLLSGTIRRIREDNLTASRAFRKTVAEIVSAFSKIKDEYIKARVADIKDVSNRILHHLIGKRRHHLVQDFEHVIIAQDLSPSDTARLRKEIVTGFATDLGTSSSHTAIMARALGIPAVVGLGRITRSVKSGEEVIIDGNRGVVVIDPNEATRRVYEEKIQRFQKYEEELTSLTSLSCETLDGYSIELACNIELPEEVDNVVTHGADSIGLMRTEFLYLKSKKAPTENQQFKIYKDMADKVSFLTVRTLDMGGDKVAPVRHRAAQVVETKLREMNPVLGWRGIRLSLGRKDLFILQLKAIIRANHRGNIRILLPMVQSVAEIRAAKACIHEASQELEKSGIPHGKNIEVGIMIEVPAASLIASALAKEVDFLSIGSNDLTQYTLACDRTNPRVSEIYNPLHPAVLKLIRHTIEASHAALKWVSCCGELASYPPAIPILIGLGIDELSVAPIYFLEVKKIIRSLSMDEVKAMASEITALDDEEAVRKYVDHIRQRLPVVKKIMEETS